MAIARIHDMCRAVKAQPWLQFTVADQTDDSVSTHLALFSFRDDLDSVLLVPAEVRLVGHETRWTRRLDDTTRHAKHRMHCLRRTS